MIMLILIVIGALGLLLGITMLTNPALLMELPKPLDVFYDPMTHTFRYTQEHAWVITLVSAALMVAGFYIRTKASELKL